MGRESKATADERREAQRKRIAELEKRKRDRASRLAAAMRLADYKKPPASKRKKEYS